jgi:hypothetical protein
MVHPHALSHHVRRQRNSAQELDDEVEEVIVTVTMPNTDVVWVTESSKPPQRTKIDSDPKPTSPAVTSKKPTAKESSSEQMPKPTSSAKEASSDKQTSSSLVTATPSRSDLSSHAAVATATSSLVAGIASSSSSSSPSAPAEAATSTGMSGGAKAGIALGILLAVAAVLGAVLLFYHRKKKSRVQEKVDDEKIGMHSAPPPPPPQVEATPSSRTMAAAPRLSLRPVTQFDPAFPNGKSNGNLLGDVEIAMTNNRSLSPETTKSSWERLGASNAGTVAVNPFKDPQSTSSSPQNPFSNNAAIEPSIVVPSTPTNAEEFANPAFAIAAADAAVLSTPSTVRSPTTSTPPSPVWTEDIPVSPGPAPSGPLPVAASGRSARGPAPASDNVHRIQLDFKPSMSDELELRAGQLVRMLHEYDDGWALCVRMDRSQQGVVPRTCLSKHPVKPRAGPPRDGSAGPHIRASPISPAGITQHRPMSPGPRSMSPNPRHGSSPQSRARSNSNAPHVGSRSRSPASTPQTSRPRSNSAGQPAVRRAPPPGPSPMNPNANTPIPSRKPLPGQAI